MGIIAIPGMMTRAILDGSDVEQAARLQIVVMFMIAASNALSCIIATHSVLRLCVDSEYRIRGDRINTSPHAVHRTSRGAVRAIVGLTRRAWNVIMSSMWEERRTANRGLASWLSERTQLLA